MPLPPLSTYPDIATASASPVNTTANVCVHRDRTDLNPFKREIAEVTNAASDRLAAS